MGAIFGSSAPSAARGPTFSPVLCLSESFQLFGYVIWVELTSSEYYLWLWMPFMWKESYLRTWWLNRRKWCWKLFSSLNKLRSTSWSQREVFDIMPLISKNWSVSMGGGTSSLYWSLCSSHIRTMNCKTVNINMGADVSPDVMPTHRFVFHRETKHLCPSYRTFQNFLRCRAPSPVFWYEPRLNWPDVNICFCTSLKRFQFWWS